MVCFLENVNTNDSNDNPQQPKKKTVSKQNRKTERKQKHSSTVSKGTRTSEFVFHIY